MENTHLNEIEVQKEEFLQKTQEISNQKTELENNFSSQLQSQIDQEVYYQSQIDKLISDLESQK